MKIVEILILRKRLEQEIIVISKEFNMCKKKGFLHIYPYYVFFGSILLKSQKYFDI